METLYFLIIFIITLFFYIHINHELKISNDLEVYESDDLTKEKFEEILNIRQPLIINYTNERLNESCNLNKLKENYGGFDVQIRNLKNDDSESTRYIPVKLKDAYKLFLNDDEEKYFSERNEDFLEETACIKNFKYNDMFLRPNMVSACMYDFILGSKNIELPFKYDINTRNYLLVTSGSIKIKLTIPNNKKYLDVIKDYEYFEFYSNINPWNIKDKYKADFDKVKCLEVTLNNGQLISIPPYWFYSIKIVEDKTTILNFKYKTYMNNIATCLEYFVKILQEHNVKRNKEKILVDKDVVINNSSTVTSQEEIDNVSIISNVEKNMSSIKLTEGNILNDNDFTHDNIDKTISEINNM